MTPERVQKMYGYIAQHLNPDKKDYILAEKLGEVIVDIGEALDAARAEIQSLRENQRPAQRQAKKQEANHVPA